MLQPQVLFPADSNSCVHDIHARTRILMGASLAKRRAWFFSSISLTTEGGSLLILLDSNSSFNSLSIGLTFPYKTALFYSQISVILPKNRFTQDKLKPLKSQGF